MPFDVLMPWWAWLYLSFVLVMFVWGFVSDKDIKRDEVIGSIFSLFSICAFVTGFFNAYISQFFGVFLLPMVAVGVIWEFRRAIEGTESAQDELSKEQDLSDGERVILLNVAIGFNALIIVPGYVVGSILCFHMVKGLLFGA
ncbi:MAG: hypothetical protein ACRBDL_01140 [Alphaproteobacteria bacterium]